MVIIRCIVIVIASSSDDNIPLNVLKTSPQKHKDMENAQKDTRSKRKNTTLPAGPSNPNISHRSKDILAKAVPKSTVDKTVQKPTSSTGLGLTPLATNDDIVEVDMVEDASGSSRVKEIVAKK